MMATPCEAVRFPTRGKPVQSLPGKNSPKLAVALAGTEEEILQCQKLRYQVFADEMGAVIDTTIPGVDRDSFDLLSKHLLVRDTRSGEIVGTTRLLADRILEDGARYYSETEFDMKNVLELPGRFMEVGRTCIHPDYRNGSTISVLWQGLARMIVLHDVDYLIGCASIPMNDGGANVAAVMEYLREKYFAAPHLRVYPQNIVPEPVTAAVGPARVPSLLKAYLRLGAVICGEPCWDPQFSVADVFVLMDRNQIERRYARHFIQEARLA